MTEILDQVKKPKLPSIDGFKKLHERQSQRRKENFRDIIRRQAIVEFYRSAPMSSDELDSIGVQWCSGTTRPSRIYGCPDQSYWQTFTLIFMFRSQRWNLTLRGKEMPYKNFDQYVQWIKESCKQF